MIHGGSVRGKAVTKNVLLLSSSFYSSLFLLLLLFFFSYTATKLERESGGLGEACEEKHHQLARLEWRFLLPLPASSSSPPSPLSPPSFAFSSRSFAVLVAGPRNQSTRYSARLGNKRCQRLEETFSDSALDRGRAAPANYAWAKRIFPLIGPRSSDSSLTPSTARRQVEGCRGNLWILRIRRGDIFFFLFFLYADR